jgi:uncharacterized membrane protein YphA (DoxX/SURF4 family)
MKTTIKSIAYWVTTGMVASAMLSGGIAELTHRPETINGMKQLGYPVYFAMILGVWKLLGSVAFVIPGFPRLKEWAYAGIFFNMTGAAVSHLVNLRCGVKIMSTLVAKDHIVAASGGGKHHGGARYWSVLRDGHHVEEIRKAARTAVGLG